MELVGQTRGSQDVEIRARVEGYLDRVAFTEGSFVRKGDAPLPDRPQAARGGPRQREGAARDGPGPAREDEQRREPPDAPGEAAGGQPAGARQRAVRPGRGPRPGGRPEGGGRQGDARPRLHADHGAARRPRGHDRGQGGQPRRPRREHAAHDGLADRPHPLPGRHQRGRVPPARQARSRSRRRRTGRRRPRSSSSSPTAPFTPTRAASTPSSGRSTRPPAPSPCSSRSRTPSGVVRPGQYGRARFVVETKPGALLVPQRAVRSCRTSTASRWWARATRSSSAT